MSRFLIVQYRLPLRVRCLATQLTLHRPRRSSRVRGRKKRAGVNSESGKRKKPPWEVVTVKNQQGSWERILWGKEDQITGRLAGEAHVTHRLSSATFVEPKSGLPRPIVFCTRCGVYATNKAIGIKKPRTPPWSKKGKRERDPHQSQHGLEDMAVIAACSARHDTLPTGAIAEQPKTSKGGTGTSLKSLKLKRHPQHRCPLTEIQPLSKKGRKAITQTEPSDDGGQSNTDAMINLITFFVFSQQVKDIERRERFASGHSGVTSCGVP